MLINQLRLSPPVIRALRGGALLWFGALAGAGCAFLTQLLLARHLGPANFGAFTAALNTIILVSPLAGFGVAGLWLRVFGEEGWAGTRWLQASLRYAVLSTILVLLGISAWSTWGPHDATTRGLLFGLSVYLLGQVIIELVSAKLQLEARYQVLAIWQAFPHLARLALVSMVTMTATHGVGLEGATWAYIAVSLITLILGSIGLIGMYSGRLRLSGHDSPKPVNRECKPSPRDVGRQAWPFGLAGIFHLLYFQSSIVLLKYLTDDQTTGIYYAAFIITSAFYLLPGTIYQKLLLPKIHIWANHNKSAFKRSYHYGSAFMAITGTLSAIVLFAVSPILVHVLFGREYAPSAVILQILSFSIPLRYVASSVGSTMMARGVIEKKSLLMLSTALFNVSLNLLMIPRFGAMGVAVVTVASELLLLILYYMFSKRYVDFGP